MDYSDKYGIGYLLSNGVSGVFFNDSSNIVMARNTLKFFYIEKKEKKNQIFTYEINEYPSEISKKFKLFQYFQTYLNQKENNQPEEIDETSIVYLRFWLKKSRALMFILSTKIIQVSITTNFFN